MPSVYACVYIYMYIPVFSRNNKPTMSKLFLSLKKKNVIKTFIQNNLYSTQFSPFYVYTVSLKN